MAVKLTSDSNGDWLEWLFKYLVGAGVTYLKYLVGTGVTYLKYLVGPGVTFYFAVLIFLNICI